MALSSSGAECKELCWSYWDCPSRSFGGLTNLGLPLALAGLFGIAPHAMVCLGLTLTPTLRSVCLGMALTLDTGRYYWVQSSGVS